MGVTSEAVSSYRRRKPDRFTRRVWERNFRSVGQIAIALGDEPEGCVSVVFSNHHREFWKITGDSTFVLAGEAPSYDWEN